MNAETFVLPVAAAAVSVLFFTMLKVSFGREDAGQTAQELRKRLEELIKQATDAQTALDEAGTLHSQTYQITHDWDFGHDVQQAVGETRSALYSITNQTGRVLDELNTLGFKSPAFRLPSKVRRLSTKVEQLASEIGAVRIEATTVQLMAEQNMLAAQLTHAEQRITALAELSQIDTASVDRHARLQTTQRN